MKKYRVFGHTEVTVSITVEAENEEEAMEEANKQFEGIHSFCDNGCVDRLIGVSGDNDETIEESGCVEFDNCVEKS